MIARLIAVALLFAAATPVAGQSPLATRIDSYLQPLVKADSFSGTVLVAREGKILFERSYGLASIELGVPNTNDRRYRLHSITKQFTAMAIAILADHSAVDVRQSIRRYLPELPESWTGATVEHLLLHLSGIPQLENRWFSSFQRTAARTQLENLSRIASTLAQDTLVAPPGTRPMYNNFAYDLLACVVERASGMEFSQFLKANVFDPAGMTNAGFDVRSQSADGSYIASAVIPGLATGYNRGTERLQQGAPMMFGSAGAGGMYATARDLLQYDRALDAGRLISKRAFDAMIDRAYISKSDSTRGYGYGWMISRPKDGPFKISHSGGTNGYVADYARFPNERLTVIVLSNYGFVSAEAISAEISKLALAKS